jgi:uncharacterized protein YprB with RNaseH-like and TPR domain
MRAPVDKMAKQDIIMLGKKTCKHGHSYLEHYHCYMEEHGIEEKIGFFDIESSDLKANFGIMLSYCIKDNSSDTMYYDAITEEDMHDGMDKRVVKHCIEDMRRFDRLVSHYGTKFDIPFIRTRALIHKLDFPTIGEINHTDTYYMAKRLLCLNSNRQGTVAEAVQGDDIKTRISPKYWIQALRGEKKAIEYILDHNKKDAIQLEGNYKALVKYTRNLKKSI